MKISSDSKMLPVGEGVGTARQLVDNDSLEATEMSLEFENFSLRFKEPRSGNAMLFRTDRSSDETYVALDTYDRARVVALVELFAENPTSAIASIEWQENEAGPLGYISIVVAIALTLAAFYGLYVQFFK